MLKSADMSKGSSMKVVTVAHLKGGTAKTTTAGYLAHAFENMGRKVLAIDADPQGSLVRWSRRGSWTVPVRHMPGANLDKELAGLYTDGYDVAVIDTGRYDLGIVGAAMRAADIIVVPTRPGFMDLAQLKSTYKAADLAGGADRVRILLNHVPGGSTQGKDAREALTASGRQVLDADIKFRAAITASAATKPNPARGFLGYTGVALELLP